jgi:hypothetical protein
LARLQSCNTSRNSTSRATIGWSRSETMTVAAVPGAPPLPRNRFKRVLGHPDSLGGYPGRWGEVTQTSLALSPSFVATAQRCIRIQKRLPSFLPRTPNSSPFWTSRTCPNAPPMTFPRMPTVHPGIVIAATLLAGLLCLGVR